MTRTATSFAAALALVACVACEPWAPRVGTTWQWQLSGEIDTSVDVTMYDIDMLAADRDDVVDVIDALHADRRTVICYFSAGTWESSRADEPRPSDDVIGAPLEDWPDEFWLDIRHDDVKAAVANRLDQASVMGCDGVEPDNVDGYLNNSGFELDDADQRDFNLFIAEEAHARKLSVGLKNDLEHIEELVDDFDWALNEECLFFGECAAYIPFIEAGKAVFHVEYVDDVTGADSLVLDEICAHPTREGFSTLLKSFDLDASRRACDD